MFDNFFYKKFNTKLPKHLLLIQFINIHHQNLKIKNGYEKYYVTLIFQNLGIFFLNCLIVYLI